MEMHSRRGLLLAGVAGAVAVGGGSLWIDKEYEAGVYDASAKDIWRHSVAFDTPQPETQRELVRYATLAANSHNTQPWRFRLSDHAISIAPDERRRLAVVDPDNHHLFASLGCATENLAQAAAAFGLRATANFDAVAGAVNVALEKAAPFRSPIFEAIPQRQSTRSVYDGRVVPVEHLRLLESAGKEEGVQLHLFTERKQIEDILGYLVAGDSAQMGDPAFIAELKTWLRFNDSEALQTRDGLFTKASGNPPLPSWLGRLLFNLIATKDGENKKYETQMRSSPGVAVFVSGKNEPAFWTKAGRCSQRFALQATALGLKHCYINQPVEVPAIRGQFASFLGIGDRRPDLVMRFGYAPEMPRSLRRAVDEVLAPA
jgi:nitroreductase